MSEVRTPTHAYKMSMSLPTELSSRDIMSNIFMFIFAYVGFGFALFILRRRIRSKSGALIALVVAIIVFYTLAVNLLSFLGVFATVMLSKAKAAGEGGNDVNPN